MRELRKTLHSRLNLNNRARESLVALRAGGQLLAGCRGVLACSLFATLPSCFAIKHTHASLPPKPNSAVAGSNRLWMGDLFIGSKAQRSEP